MELNQIEHLDLYIYEEFKDDEGKFHSNKVSLDRDLEEGEVAYLYNGGKNKITKHGDNYLFYRFESIDTHVESCNVEYSANDIKQNITRKLDYNIEYASDRNELVHELIKANDWIYDLLSSKRVIKKEHKNKTDYLSENQFLDKEIEKIASYILFSKFKDEEEKTLYDYLKDEYRQINKANKKTNEDFIRMYSIKNELDMFNHKILSENRKIRNYKREIFKEDTDENNYNQDKEFNKDKSKLINTGKKLEINKEYWKKMNFSDSESCFRQSILDTYEDSIRILNVQLGYTDKKNKKLSIDERDSVRKELLRKLPPIEFFIDERKVVISSQSRINKIMRMRNELVRDYNKTKEFLAEVISFQQMTPTSTIFDFNNDTWYQDEHGKIVELSRNALLFSNINTYKGLILNYFTLKDKYKDKFDNDMWAILWTFEEIVNNTDLSNEEKFVLKSMANDLPQKEIIKYSEKKFGKSLSSYMVSNWINHVIPRKLLNTYLNSVDRWLYTFKMKGTYKKCSSCSEIKLISNDRYFGKDSRNKDGHKSLCKKCDSYTKKAK